MANAMIDESLSVLTENIKELH